MAKIGDSFIGKKSGPRIIGQGDKGPRPFQPGKQPGAGCASCVLLFVVFVATLLVTLTRL